MTMDNMDTIFLLVAVVITLLALQRGESEAQRAIDSAF
jgi:hypothetical protein